MTPTSQHKAKEKINSAPVNGNKSKKVTEIHPENHLSKTINGAIKLENDLIDIKQESTEQKISNCNEMRNLYSRSPLHVGHVSSQEDMMDHKNLSSSA